MKSYLEIQVNKGECDESAYVIVNKHSYVSRIILHRSLAWDQGGSLTLPETSGLDTLLRQEIECIKKGNK